MAKNLSLRFLTAAVIGVVFLCWWNGWATYLALSSEARAAMVGITVFCGGIFGALVFFLKNDAWRQRNPFITAEAINLLIVLCTAVAYALVIRAVFSEEFAAMSFDAVPARRRSFAPSSRFIETFFWGLRWAIVFFVASVSSEKGWTQTLAKMFESLSRGR